MAENVGIGTAVIGTLRRFRDLKGYKEVPIDYLPEATNRRPSEISATLTDLQRDGVVMIVGDKVRLMSKTEMSS
jgi:hypothetical protein